MLSRLPEKIGLDLLLLLSEEVELVAQKPRTPSGTGRKALLPVVAVTRAVDGATRRLDPSRSIQALQARLDANEIARRCNVRSRELPKQRERLRRLEDPPVERPGPELLGQAIGIPLVAFLAAALGHTRYHHLGHMRAQRLVEPGALQLLAACGSSPLVGDC